MHTQTQGVIMKMLSHCSPMSLPESSSVDNLKSTLFRLSSPYWRFLKDLRGMATCLTWILLLVQTYKLTCSLFQVVSRTINYSPKFSFQNNMFSQTFLFSTLSAWKNFQLTCRQPTIATHDKHYSYLMSRFHRKAEKTPERSHV